MKIFDYLFYRIYNFYKRNRDSTPMLMGYLVLSLTCCLSILSFIALLSLFGDVFILQGNILKIVALLILIILPFLWKKRYEKGDILSVLEHQYKDEPLNKKRLKGWVFSIYLATVLLIPITIGYIRHNLGIGI